MSIWPNVKKKQTKYMKRCRDILKRIFPRLYRGLTRERQIYGQYPPRRKIRGDKGRRVRRRKYFFRGRIENIAIDIAPEITA